MRTHVKGYNGCALKGTAPVTSHCTPEGTNFAIFFWQCSDKMVRNTRFIWTDVSVSALSFFLKVHTDKYFYNKINSTSDVWKLFKILQPLSLSITSLTSDDFAKFFTDKTKTFLISTQRNKLHSYFSALANAELSKHFSHPTTCPLDLIPSHLLWAISPTLLPALNHTHNVLWYFYAGQPPCAIKPLQMIRI